MKKYLIINGVKVLLTMLTPTALVNIADGIIDMIEDAIKESETEIDNEILEPIIQSIRTTFNIPDNDEPEKA